MKERFESKHLDEEAGERRTRGMRTEMVIFCPPGRFLKMLSMSRSFHVVGVMGSFWHARGLLGRDGAEDAAKGKMKGLSAG